MIFVGTEAMQKKMRRPLRLANGTDYFKGEYLQAPEGAALSPQAFLVEQAANSTILTHFHRQNQFQVVVGGTGTIGRHELKPLAVHYAGAYTGYGPLISGPEGLQYLTLRHITDAGANFLPEARDELARGPKRHYTSDALAQADAAELQALAAPRVTEVLPLQDDGLAVIQYALPPGGACATLAPATGAGQFLLVLGGGLVHGDATLGYCENLFVSPDEPAYELHAGAQGAEVLLLQYPPRDAAYEAH